MIEWLYYGLLFLLGNRPVVMTAARRDSLVNDEQALSLAMQVIGELRAELAEKSEEEHDHGA